MARPFVYGRGPQAQTDTKGAAIGGSARVPRVGTTRSDLEAQATQNGWSPRELKYADIQAMSSAELRYHEVCNAENFQAALDRHKNIEDDRQHQQYWNIKKQWMGVTAVTENDKTKMRDVAERFFQLYPQVIRDKANADKIWDYMKQNNLLPTEIASPIQAFEDLAQDPNSGLALNPSAISAGSEQNISGTELTSHRHFHLLLQSHRRPTVEESLSADQYKARHTELQDNRVPPVIARRIAQQQATDDWQKQAEAVTNRSSIVSITDYKLGNKQ